MSARHQAVYCTFTRNGRAEVLTLKPKSGGTEVKLYPGMNALDAKTWAAIVADPDARTKQLLEDKIVDDKGLAPEDVGPPEPEAEDQAVAKPAPASSPDAAKT